MTKKEKQRIRSKEWYLKNKDKAKLYSKEYADKTREKRRERQRVYYKKHKEMIDKRNSLWMKKNTEAVAKAKFIGRLASVYNLSLDQYNKMFEDQNGCCAICNITEKDNKKRLAIDHCHKTNKVRQLLCSNCNVVLGLLDDDISKFESCIRYLERHK